MKSSIEVFNWYRCLAGHEWIDSRSVAFYGSGDEVLAQETRFLVERREGNPLYRQFHPIVDSPTLYREFAHLDDTEEAYLAFANRYGWLGIQSMLVREQGTYASFRQTSGEPFHQWRIARIKMRRVTDVLDAIQARDSAAIQRWFTFLPGRVLYHRKDDGLGEQMSVVSAPENDIRKHIWDWASAAPDGERPFRFAAGYAQQEINDAMSNSDGDAAATFARVVLDGDRDVMSLRMVPGNLLAAMWLQCARVLTLNPTFKDCEYCGKWFELSPDARRKQSKYCSGRCKVAAYRKRNSNIYVWMIPYYRQARMIPDWESMTLSQQADALKSTIEAETEGVHANTLASIDRANRWPRALEELGQSDDEDAQV